MNTKSKFLHKKLLVGCGIFLLILAILSGAAYFYLTDYYPAQDVALEVLAQGGEYFGPG